MTVTNMLENASLLLRQLSAIFQAKASLCTKGSFLARKVIYDIKFP